MGEAISHAVLPGVAIAYMMGFSFFAGAALSGMTTALGIGYITQNSRIKQDSAIGIMFTAAFALGIVLISMKKGTGVDLWHILFGNVLAVSPQNLLTTAATGAGALACVVLLYKQLLLSTFDPVMAQAIGVPVRVIHYLLVLMLSLVTVASLKTVGVVLVVAMLVTPGATACLLSNRLPVMLFLAALCGIVSAVTGLYCSFMYDLSTGASMVLAASFLFGAAFFFSPSQGLVTRHFIKRFKRDKTFSPGVHRSHEKED